MMPIYGYGYRYRDLGHKLCTLGNLGHECGYSYLIHEMKSMFDVMIFIQYINAITFICIPYIFYVVK